jgi:hypothetical protein
VRLERDEFGMKAAAAITFARPVGIAECAEQLGVIRP